MKHTAFWRRIDTPGHDACLIKRVRSNWVLSGSAAYLEDQIVTGVSYHIICDPDWLTLSAQVSGWSGGRDLKLDITRDINGNWIINGENIESVAGCTDVDLGFTPATNTCAIRRLNLKVLQREQVMTAWLDTSDWRFKPREQYYLRRAQNSYEYSSAAHGFQARLKTDNDGLVRHYPGLWISDR